MTTIRASCPTCGDVTLGLGDITVRVCSDDASGAYLFRCPRCAQAVTRPASERIVDVLVSSGVRLEVWRLPAELNERPNGPPFSPDDLLALHERLQDPGWFDDVVALLHGSGDAVG